MGSKYINNSNPDFDFIDCRRHFLQIKRVLMFSDCFLLQRERTADVVVAEKAMSEEKTRKILAWRTVQAKDETEMTTLPGKGEVVVLEVDLIVEEKVPKGTLTPQTRREPIEREEASTGEEGVAEAEEALVEEAAVVDLVRVVVVVAVEAASAGSENLKEEVAAIARKLLLF